MYIISLTINEGLLGYTTGKWGEFEPLVNERGYFETGDLVRLHKNQVVYLKKIWQSQKTSDGLYVDVVAVE